jgi:hypothetical protein
LGPPTALLLGAPGLAVGLAAAGVLADRAAFYALASVRTTESEVRRVERILEGRARDPIRL